MFQDSKSSKNQIPKSKKDLDSIKPADPDPVNKAEKKS
jgi:hypothetical protein